MEQRAMESWEPGLRAPNANIEDRPIGRILMDMGKLKPRDVDRVFALHREKGLRFGEAARKLRLVKDADIQYALAVQFDHPYLKPGQGFLGPELVVAHESNHRSEALRDLRTQLLLQWMSPERKVLAVISPGSKDGRSYLAANLAVAFAQLGEKTLLIDADLRFPRQHRIFGVPNRLGLAHVLAGRAGIEAGERISYFESLTVLSAGAAPPNPLELLSRQTLPQLLAEARKKFTVVLIDTPAGSRSSDAKVVSARADGVLMVVRQDQTRLAEVERLRHAIADFGVKVVGTVLNQY